MVVVDEDVDLLKLYRNQIQNVYVTLVLIDDSIQSKSSFVLTTYHFQTAIDHDIDRKHHRL